MQDQLILESYAPLSLNCVDIFLTTVNCGMLTLKKKAPTKNELIELKQKVKYTRWSGPTCDANLSRGDSSAN